MSPGAPSRQREYWSFYWPLALTGAVGVIATQVQNGVLARYEDAVTELAVFALAQSVFGLFNAALNFTPQLATQFARGPAARGRTLAFVLTVATAFAAIVATVGVAGDALLEAAFGIEPAMRARVDAYLVLLGPVLLLNGWRLFQVGLLVQARRTGRVTLLNTLYLGTVVAVLVAGFAAGAPATGTLVGAQAIAAAAHGAVGTVLVRSLPGGPAEPAPTVRRLLAFFLPVATTGVMFALSRPVLYAFVARMPDGLTSIAALRVGFDFTFLFQQASNQFRHFFVAFGLDDLPGKRRFMGAVTAGITGLMLAVAATPLGDLVLRHGLGVRGAVLDRALDVILVMTGLPVVIIVRNYFHGILMVRERTGGMAVGGVLRVGGIAGLAALTSAAGWLDHVVAAWILLAGFAVETGVVGLRVRGVRRADRIAAASVPT
ncbi:MAG: hypothetical protein V2J02_00110 [Pseudomonadales bacterium]|nr:hypothetical protein [Pseudomonadales bacterium]